MMDIYLHCSSNLVSLWARQTFGQTPLVEVSQVRLTFGQPLGQADLQSDGPHGRGI